MSGGGRYDRKFNRNTAGRFEPVKAGKQFGKVITNSDEVDNGQVDNKENAGGLQRKIIIPVISGTSGALSNLNPT